MKGSIQLYTVIYSVDVRTIKVYHPRQASVLFIEGSTITIGRVLWLPFCVTKVNKRETR